MNMSFQMTQAQILDESKDVTRRVGPFWRRLKEGDSIIAVDRCQGFKKGEHPTVLAYLEVVSNREEHLCAITQDEVRREGFPNLTPRQFVVMFCEAHKRRGVTPETIVNRIQFRHVPF